MTVRLPHQNGGFAVGEHPPISEQERVEAAYPRWMVWQSDDTGRWWASVRVNLTVEQERAGAVPHLAAGALGELEEEMAAEDARIAQVGMPPRGTVRESEGAQS